MNPKVIGSVITLATVLAWILGIIILLGSNPFMGILVIILAIVLTYASSVWKREMHHQEVLEAIKDVKDDQESDD